MHTQDKGVGKMQHNSMREWMRKHCGTAFKIEHWSRLSVTCYSMPRFLLRLSSLYQDKASKRRPSTSKGRKRRRIGAAQKSIPTTCISCSIISAVWFFLKKNQLPIHKFNKYERLKTNSHAHRIISIRIGNIYRKSNVWWISGSGTMLGKTCTDAYTSASPIIHNRHQQIIIFFGIL